MSFILTAIALLSSIFGGKKVIDGLSDNNKAKNLNNKAYQIYHEAETELIEVKNTTVNSLEELGNLKLQVWDRSISGFMKIIDNVGGWKLNRFVNNWAKQSSNKNFSEELKEQVSLNKQEFLQMKSMALNASDLIKGGTVSLASGSLLAIATYNVVAILGTASTGTAIATLSGIAASNATLAWLGGGALAVGGQGIVGGIAVLGGIVAAPVLAVGGFIFASKARKNLEIAQENLEKAKEDAAAMITACEKLELINEMALKYNSIIIRLDTSMLLILSELKPMLEKAFLDAEQKAARSLWFKIKRFFFGSRIQVKIRKLNENQRSLLLTSFNYAAVMRKVLIVPLLTEAGTLTSECYQILDYGKKFLEMQRNLENDRLVASSNSL